MVQLLGNTVGLGSDPGLAEAFVLPPTRRAGVLLGSSWDEPVVT